MQYLLFLLFYPVRTFFSRGVIFQQNLIQIGKKRDFVDKAAPFQPISFTFRFDGVIAESDEVENGRR